MEAFIEFQSFIGNNNRYIVKELAIVSDSFRCQLLFKPPYEFERLNDKMRRTARWLARHYHLIRWESGEMRYNEGMIKLLCKPFKVIYTTGDEKARFLRKFHPRVVDVYLNSVFSSVNFNCENNEQCIYPAHNSTHERCALHRACVLFKLYKTTL
jgi:hypothetical protein